MSVLALFRRWLSEQEFHPGPLGWLVNPFFIARRSLARQVRACSPRITGRVLDVGCGSKPYLRYFEGHVDQYFGIDIEKETHDHSNEDVNLIFDGETLPFEDGSFDSAVTFQVLEHVFAPDRFVSELRRVLRPGGALLLTAPFIWEEHEQPLDYGRYTSFGLRHLLEKNGFEVASLDKVGQGLLAVVQVFNADWYSVTARVRPEWLRLAVSNVVTAPITAFGLLLSLILPRSKNLYLDIVVVAKAV